MGSLTEAAFTERLQRGCAACGGKKLFIETYVEGVFALDEGESDGSVAWAYKGETFVDGVFEVRCAGCKEALFADPACPRCHAPGGLARALEAGDRRPPPPDCPRCGAGELRYRAFVPVTMAYEGKRVGKAKTSCEPDDPGFHGVRAECPACGPLDAPPDGCPLCDAAGPIRPQP